MTPQICHNPDACPVTDLSSACGVCLQRAQDAVQLLSLAVLLSSTFVFNQMGPIDEAALDRLSLVTQITKHVRVRATGPATGEQSHAAAAAAGGVGRRSVCAGGGCSRIRSRSRASAANQQAAVSARHLALPCASASAGVVAAQGSARLADAVS